MIGVLTNVLQDIYLDGTIKECVVRIKDNNVQVQAMDIADCVFVQSSVNIDLPFEAELGIGDLGTFIKYLNVLQGQNVSFKQNDNVLVVKPETGAVVRYQLAEKDTIPSYDEEWPENLIEKELKKYKFKLELKQSAVSEFLSMMGLFNPNVTRFEVAKQGKVYLHGGVESEHQFTVYMGKCKKAPEMDIKVFGKNLVSVFKTVDFSNNPVLNLHPDKDALISSDVSNWIIRRITE